MSEEKNIVSEEDFQKLWELNKDGDPDYAFQLLNTTIETAIERNDKNWNTNKPYTFEDIYEAYKNYLDYWDYTYADVDEQFIKEQNKKMRLSKFLQTGSFKKEFSIKKKPRDNYLFGSNNVDTLLREVRNFKDKLGLNG